MYCKICGDEENLTRVIFLMGTVFDISQTEPLGESSEVAA